jgi:hypothetical protein
LADAVGELRMAFDEVGSRLVRILELADLSREPGLLAFEGLSVRFGRALPGTLSGLQGVGAGRETSATAVPGEESTVRIQDAAEVLFVASASNSEILVACSDGCVGPPSGAFAEVGQVLFEDVLLFS